MSLALTIARPYARAAFALARQAGDMPGWSASLSVSAQIAADPRIVALVSLPALDRSEAVSLLAPPSCDETFRRFLDVLAENDRLALLPEIASQYEQLRAEAEHVVHARVVSATPLSTEEQSKIEQALRKRMNADVTLQLSVDPALIGGAVIDTGDTVIDGSLRSKLARLETALTQ